MFKAKTAAEISKTLRSEVKAQIPGSDPWIWPNNLYIATKVFSQALHATYKTLEWLLRQVFAATADGIYLEQHGIEIGVTRLDASFAVGTATAVTTIGTVIPINTMMTRSDGALFRTTAAYAAIAASTVIAMRADDAGRAWNTDSGTALALVTPIVGVGTITVDTGAIKGGTDQENLESLRARILQRKANPPRGGSPSEYVQWALAKPGVTRAFVRRATPAAGSVTVYFMMDDDTATGIPTAAHVSDLQTRLGALAPADANVIAAAPTSLAVNVTVQDLTPSTQTIRDSVTAEIKSMFRRRARPGTAATAFIFSRSWIGQAVSSASGESQHVLAAPTGDTSCGSGIIAVPGTIAFT